MIDLGRGAILHHADCRDVLRGLASDSLDSCCTDPPYALVSTLKRFANSPRSEAAMPTAGPYARASRGFMGCSWDTGETAFSVEFWAEVLRCLKPGAFVAAFGASRGYHRMACAIEDAGFEIRDSLMWLYGTGFPKSHDVSKGIDKRGGNSHLTRDIGQALKAARESRGMSAAECDKCFCGGTTNWSWFEGRPVGQRAPTAATFALICSAWPELLPLMDAVAEVERETIGQKTSGIANSNEGARHTIGASSSVVVDITAPAAREWEGWGTALKPAFEPIVLARKPLSEGTVAANVCKWRTGALNIDACRIHTEGESTARAYTAKRTAPGATQNATGERKLESEIFEGASKEGRWPANVVHDGSDEVVGAFPYSAGQLARARTDGSPQNNSIYGALRHGTQNPEPRGDSGSAARFFYSAKASRGDRAGSKHPTVKPIALMEWLCRLITPPGGTVLDPFAGSGTTGAAAINQGLRAVLCEREAEYVADIRRRLGAAQGIGSLLVAHARRVELVQKMQNRVDNLRAA